MKFKSLGELSSKELLEYGIIGLFLGGAFNTIFKPGVIIEMLFDFVVLLGWICLIWGIIKWRREKKRQKTESSITYCSKCGAKIEKNSNFCAKCGNKTN